MFVFGTILDNKADIISVIIGLFFQLAHSLISEKEAEIQRQEKVNSPSIWLNSKKFIPTKYIHICVFVCWDIQCIYA